MSLTRRGKTASPASVIRLDAYRPKYLRQREPEDPFLRAAAADGRIIRAALSLPDLSSADLRHVLGRMRGAIGAHLDSGTRDPLVHGLQVLADALDAAISARGW